MTLTIKSLLNTFSEHAIKAENNRLNRIEEFKENYPEDKIPDHMLETFNLPEALAVMCKEIIELRIQNE